MRTVIQNKRATLQVLGGILKNPEILLRGEYKIEQSDFPETIHNIIFSSVVELLKGGATEVNGITMDNFLSSKPIQYKVFQDNRGIELVDKMIQVAQEHTFEYWYEMMKKFSLLRTLDANGFDIKEFYDENETNVDKIEAMSQRLSNMKLDEIVKHYDKTMIGIKEKWIGDVGGSTTFQAGDGLDELLAKLEEGEQFGHSFVNPFITTAFMGMKKSKFLLFSGASGSGKSRTQMANAVHVAVPYIYDGKKGSWMKKDEEVKPVLYISTELTKEEVQLMFLAYLSGVEEDRIKQRAFNKSEYQRIKIAKQLLEEAPLYCECIEDFDIKDIEVLIERAIIGKQVEYVFYDYLHTTPKLMTYYNQSTGVRMQEHQILYLFGNSLKQIANKYDICLYSSTQLNRGYKDEQNLDATALRGALSLSDKVDGGIISVPPSEKDISMLKDVIASVTYGVEPNMCHTIYKNRGNKWKSVRIWTRINLGNVREEPLFITDDRYRLITDMEGTEPPMEKVTLELKEE